MIRFYVIVFLVCLFNKGLACLCVVHTLVYSLTEEMWMFPIKTMRGSVGS